VQLIEVFMGNEGAKFLDAEKSILELDHSEQPLRCAGMDIPKALTTAIRYHHNPTRSHVNLLAYFIMLRMQ
jgi:hypothetical protein